MDNFTSQENFCFVAVTLYPKILLFYFPGVAMVGSSAMTCEPIIRWGWREVFIQHLVESYVGYITGFTNGT